MFIPVFFKKVSWVLFGALVVLSAVTLTSCGKTYEIKASSESIGSSGDVLDLDIQDIYKDNKPIPLDEWKEALASRDYTVTPVMSPKLRKRLSEEGR
ncbi:MAG: hypothetical protein RLY49_376 [Candidatus Parcubacteria bacterium]|jgi:hypothetical protein